MAPLRATSKRSHDTTRDFLFAPNQSPDSFSPASSPTKSAQPPIDNHEQPSSPSRSRTTSLTFLDPMTPVFPTRRQSILTLGGRRSSRSQAARRIVSHAAKKPDGHIPRPPNCFLLYRSWVRQQQKLAAANDPDGNKKSEQKVSVIVGTLWEDLPEEKKEIFRAEARRLKAEHLARYPGYKYSPRTKKGAQESERLPKRSTKKMAPEEIASSVEEANKIISKARQKRVKGSAEPSASSTLGNLTSSPGAGPSTPVPTTTFIPYRRSSSCPPVAPTFSSPAAASLIPPYAAHSPIPSTPLQSNRSRRARGPQIEIPNVPSIAGKRFSPMAPRRIAEAPHPSSEAASTFPIRKRNRPTLFDPGYSLAPLAQQSAPIAAAPPPVRSPAATLAQFEWPAPKSTHSNPQPTSRSPADPLDPMSLPPLDLGLGSDMLSDPALGPLSVPSMSTGFVHQSPLQNAPLGTFNATGFAERSQMQNWVPQSTPTEHFTFEGNLSIAQDGTAVFQPNVPYSMHTAQPEIHLEYSAGPIDYNFDQSAPVPVKDSLQYPSASPFNPFDFNANGHQGSSPMSITPSLQAFSESEVPSPSPSAYSSAPIDMSNDGSASSSVFLGMTMDNSSNGLMNNSSAPDSQSHMGIEWTQSFTPLSNPSPFSSHHETTLFSVPFEGTDFSTDYSAGGPLSASAASPGFHSGGSFLMNGGSGSGAYGLGLGSFGSTTGLGTERRLSSVRRASAVWLRRPSLAGDLAGVGLGEL